MSRIFCLVALALTAAAAAASVGQASPGNDPKPVDPLAVSYLMGQGLSPSEIRAWTVGECSQATKPASCFVVLDRMSAPVTPKPVDPLAVSYLMGLGLSPSEVKAWTVGICSHPTRPALCFAPFQRTAAAASTSTSTQGSGRFDWRAAGIGAGAALGVALLLAGMGASLLISRNNRRRQVAGA